MASSLDYLDELDRLLLGQGDDCMLLTQLDGFLTGIIVSPDLIGPGQWLKTIWAGNDGEGIPVFDDAGGMQHFVDLVMHHYHEILASLAHPGEFEPVLEIDTRTDETLWEMWIEGFGQAMDLAPAGWTRVMRDDDAGCLAAIEGICALRAFANGTRQLTRAEEDRWDAQAPDLIPIWVEMLHQWQLENDPNRPASVKRQKIGRNDPCPCGSGRKYKKCCGLH
ncbi:UPF0149 family protein [Sphingobium ummariense]